MNIQINLDPTDADELAAAKALLAKLSGESDGSETTSEGTNDRPRGTKGKKDADDEPPADDEPADDEPADDEPADDEPAKEEKKSKKDDDSDGADKAAELRVLAKKLIAKDKKAMANILKKFSASAISEIPPFKIEKAIALIEAELEA